MIDLHVHSNKSDGSMDIHELIDYALQKGLSAMAITDHDTVDGLLEATQYAIGKPIQIIPGIEFSTEYEGKDIHILGLYIQYQTPVFQEKIQEFVNSRILRNEKMCQSLTQHNVPVTYSQLQHAFPGSVITRAHYARYLLQNGYVTSMPEAFDRYIGDHAPCFIPREKVTPSDAVKLIHEADGFAVLAHPVLYHMNDKRLNDLVASLKEVGLDGIEAIYSTYSAADERYIRSLAEKYHLCISGGSDFHGAAKPGLDLATGYGKFYIPDELLLPIKKQLELQRSKE